MLMTLILDTSTGPLIATGDVSERMLACSEGLLSLSSAMQGVADGLLLDLAGKIMASRRATK